MSRDVLIGLFGLLLKLVGWTAIMTITTGGNVHPGADFWWGFWAGFLWLSWGYATSNRVLAWLLAPSNPKV